MPIATLGRSAIRARDTTDLRATLAPAVLAVLSGTLFLADRALEGTAQTVAWVVLLTSVLVALAWFGSAARRSTGTDPDSRG